jgi:hypothetical protein
MKDSEKRKLARARLRRLRARAKLRELEEKTKRPSARPITSKPPVAIQQPEAASPARSPDKRESKQHEEQRQHEINALERDIVELSRLTDPTDATATDIDRIRHEVEELKRDFYSHLDSWQKLQLARHPQRPYTDDFIRLLFEDFSEIHGDRNFADDPAMLAGMARFRGRPVLIVGNQKRARHEAALGS